MKRGLLLLFAPIAGIALVICAVVLRPEALGRPKKGGEGAYADSPVEATLPTRALPAKVPGRPAPPETVAKKTEEVRIRSTFANYRTAIATGNTRLAGALLPVLMRDRDVAFRCAQEEAVNASTDLDKELAKKTLEAFRR